MTVIMWVLNAEGWGEDVVAVCSCPEAARKWIEANPPETGWYWTKKVPALNTARMKGDSLAGHKFEERLGCRSCGHIA